MYKKIKILTFILILSCTNTLLAQETFNYDEEKVKEYSLPSLLTLNNGKEVKSVTDWQNRREEILNLFKEHVYGKFPEKPKSLRFEILKIDKTALSGKATSKQIRIHFSKNVNNSYMDMIVYIPNKTSKPSPVFVGLNFRGNQSIHIDSSIINSVKHPILLSNTNKSNRLIAGEQKERWEIETIIDKGFATATAYYGDLELDYPDGWKTGIRTTLQKELNTKPDEWAAISAWAWGLSRMLDYLETDKQIDAKRAIVHGHSRLGKAALWAGVNDTRFAAVISNNSGEGGAALSRRWFGETVNRINKNFPYWFIQKYKSYNNNESYLPVDQHMLLALVAPRPLYVASATEDLWADPKGEFLSALNAEPIYTLYNKKGLGTKEVPAADTSIGETISYHIRTGKHNILLFDWLQYINFANKNL